MHDHGTRRTNPPHVKTPEDAPAPVPGRAIAGTPAVQRRATVVGRGGDAPAAVHDAAARGVATSSARLPFGDVIQRAFGRHDISGIQAHTGPEAAASARAMGAEAYATGGHVVLGDRADLHTVAHEAAHVVQQRAGVHLKGGVGAEGDTYERHADAVADAVVSGRSAERLLDQHAGAAPAATAPAAAVQRKPFSLKSENRKEDDKRPEPKDLMEFLMKVHPVLGYIWQAEDILFRLVIDYSAGKDHGGTKIDRVEDKTVFLVTLYWDPEETVSHLAATFLHEVVLHVLPAASKHKKAVETGKLSELAFPQTKEDIAKAEAQEHANPQGWLAALKSAMQMDKGVVQEIVRDMIAHLELDGAIKVCAQANMPAKVFEQCLEGTFAGGSKDKSGLESKSKSTTKSEGDGKSTSKDKEDSNEN